MRPDQTFPRLWLLSDARNDHVLESALRHMPRGSGFIFRHYHLDGANRRNRFRELARIARIRAIVCVLSGTPKEARRWGADGSYGAPLQAAARLATAHGLREIGRANRSGATAILLSPVFRTRSHPDAKVLGPVRFRLLARRAQMPVIALGGMDSRKASGLDWPRWAAIDGLSMRACADWR